MHIVQVPSSPFVCTHMPYDFITDHYVCVCVLIRGGNQAADDERMHEWLHFL